MNDHPMDDERGVVRVEGPDALTLLQALVTNDLDGLAVGGARFAALLTPQGKIMFDFFVVRTPAADGACFLLDCPATLTAALVMRLSLYRLRARVEIRDETSERSVIWANGLPPKIPGAFVFVDPRDPRLGWRAIAVRGFGPKVSRFEAACNEAHRIALGVPRGGADFNYSEIFPADANMDLLNGVDFKKGCYVGQEVVSRMHHRGGVRKRFCIARFEGSSPLTVGAPVLAGSAAIGTLGTSADGHALALVRLDRLEDARQSGETLTVEGEAIRIEPPPA